jgi:Spy/CpxP family protein refolding chaperone
MKNLKFRTIVMLLAAVLLSLNTNVFAQTGYGNGNGQGNGNSQGYFCDNIPNLTTDQQTKIEKQRTTQWKEMQNYRNQLNEKRARLQTLRSVDNADMSTINKTIDEIGVIQTSMQKKREQHFQDVRNLLTDDQRVYFDNFHSGRGNGQGRGNGYCRGNGQGRGNGSGRGKGNCRRNM